MMGDPGIICLKIAQGHHFKNLNSLAKSHMEMRTIFWHED